MWDQENRNKKITKMSSTGEGMDRREENTSINLRKVCTIIMFNEASTEILLHSVRSMKVINPLMNRTRKVI